MPHRFCWISKHFTKHIDVLKWSSNFIFSSRAFSDSPELSQNFWKMQTIICFFLFFFKCQQFLHFPLTLQNSSAFSKIHVSSNMFLRFTLFSRSFSNSLEFPKDIWNHSIFSMISEMFDDFSHLPLIFYHTPVFSKIIWYSKMLLQFICVLRLFSRVIKNLQKQNWRIRHFPTFLKMFERYCVFKLFSEIPRHFPKCIDLLTCSSNLVFCFRKSRNL